eukprot:11227644-Karenia_brevis.AAC.1
MVVCKRYWKADVRENERLNEMISLLCERCPSISEALLSARVGIKHALGRGSTDHDGVDRTAKFSAVAPIAEKLSKICAEAWSEGKKIWEEGSRFAAPARITDVPHPS